MGGRATAGIGGGRTLALPDYYELFVFDPDGVRVEVGCEEPVPD